jgi:hypothetical protein
MQTAELEHKVLELEPRDRARLARLLLESLQEISELEIQELWLDEAERRDRAVDEGKMQLIPSDEVMKEAWARLS